MKSISCSIGTGSGVTCSIGVSVVPSGIRPLVKSSEAAGSAALSREHTIHVARSGLLTIAGGKWTTYRRMAEDCVDHAATLARLEERPCVTRSLRIHGYHEHPEDLGDLRYYGSDAPAIRELMQKEPELAQRIGDSVPIHAAQVAWAVWHEMARTVEDVLARHTRVLLLDAGAAIDVAPQVALIMARELGRDDRWTSDQVTRFSALARNYRVRGAHGPLK